MNSTAMVHEIVGLNGFYCTKAYGSGYAKVTSIQYSDERARRVNGQYVEVGDVVVELNGDSTANIKSQSGIVSILRSRLTSYVIKSPGNLTFVFYISLITKIQICTKEIWQTESWQKE